MNKIRINRHKIGTRKEKMQNRTLSLTEWLLTDSAKLHPFFPPKRPLVLINKTHREGEVSRVRGCSVVTVGKGGLAVFTMFRFIGQ